MSRKFFKGISVAAAVCCVLFFVVGGFQLTSEAFRCKDDIALKFEQLDSVFMNQLKINDAVSEELKSLLREKARTDTDIASIAVFKNGEKIYSAVKSTPSGEAVYSENKNLLLAKTSRNYDLEDAERYSLTVAFRILSEADISAFFFQTLILFLLLAVVLTSLTVIALKRKKSPAGPLFDEIEISRHPEAVPESAADGGDGGCGETAEENEDEPFVWSDLPDGEGSEEDGEASEDESTEQKAEERDEIIDLDFKDASFEVSADEIICRAAENKENCVVMATGFKSAGGGEKDEEFQARWETYLSEHGGVFKTERKKTVAVFPRYTLTDGIKLIQDFRESGENEGDYVWNAGITALNGRKMRYEEMINEADRALIKSQLDNDNTVVCFNADAEKYNRYSKID